MKTMVEPKTNENTTKEFDLKEAFVMWRNQGKNGGYYLKGQTPEGVKLVGFFNSKKENPKEPDIKIYAVNEEGKRDIEVASLWENISKADKRYLSGKTNENEDLRGFFGKEDQEMRPYIRVYYK